MKLAVLGASGFVGSRVVEIFHLRRHFQVRAVVRTYGALTRLGRFDLEWRLADGCDETALAQAMDGCDLVLNCIAGDARLIKKSATTIYRAAARQRVRRLVFLSSAVVHGQNPAPGTTEESPLVTHDRDYRSAYNRAKVAAEGILRQERRSGTTELVILRPGIVFGPRAHWIFKTADALMDGTFAWVNRGRGICNSIYVDNLVEAIRLALTVPGIDREAFLVGDRETSTWADLFLPIAASLGMAPEELVDLPTARRSFSWRGQIEALHGSRVVQRLIRWTPMRLKRSVKAGLREWLRPPAASPWALASCPNPMRSVRREMEILYQCGYRLPQTKAEMLLGYSPPVSFSDGVGRSIRWLKFAGYPVRCNP